MTLDVPAVSPRPLRGSPEAGVAILEDALRWIDGFPERYPITTPSVVDHARRLIREYALHPDELARSVKAQLWAAGALHAAFHADSPGVDAGTFARAFGVIFSGACPKSRTARGRRPSNFLRQEEAAITRELERPDHVQIRRHDLDPNAGLWGRENHA